MQPHDTQIRSYSYQLPRTTPRDFAQLTGLEFMRGYLTADVPRAPMAATLDFEITRVEFGLPVVEATPAEWS